MGVICNRCNAEYEFEEALISVGGTTVKCTNCGHLFKVYRQRSAEPALPLPRHPWLVIHADGRHEEVSSLREITQRIRTGRLADEDRISRTGRVFRKLGDIAELRPFFRKAPSSATTGILPEPQGQESVAANGTAGGSPAPGGAHAVLDDAPPPPAVAPTRPARMQAFDDDDVTEPAPPGFSRTTPPSGVVAPAPPAGAPLPATNGGHEPAANREPSTEGGPGTASARRTFSPERQRQSDARLRAIAAGVAAVAVALAAAWSLGTQGRQETPTTRITSARQVDAVSTSDQSTPPVRKAPSAGAADDAFLATPDLGAAPETNKVRAKTSDSDLQLPLSSSGADAATPPSVYQTGEAAGLVAPPAASATAGNVHPNRPVLAERPKPAIARSPKPEVPSDRANTPRTPMAQLALLCDQGDAALNAGEVPEAEALYQQARILRPSSPRVATGLARVALRRGDSERGLALLTSAVRRKYSDAYIELAAAYHELGRTQAAVDTYRAYLTQYPRGRHAGVARRQLELLSAAP